MFRTTTAGIAIMISVALSYSKEPTATSVPVEESCFEIGKKKWDVKNYAEAVKWFSKGAQEGDTNCKVFLGTMYEDGRGVPKNYAEAVKYYKEAANKGNSKGMCNLGCLYHEGLGVPQDYSEAAKWFRKAAEAGDADSMFYLGWAFKRGEGVPEDETEAQKWFRMSLGARKTASNLGTIYEGISTRELIEPFTLEIAPNLAISCQGDNHVNLIHSGGHVVSSSSVSHGQRDTVLITHMAVKNYAVYQHWVVGVCFWGNGPYKNPHNTKYFVCDLDEHCIPFAEVINDRQEWEEALSRLGIPKDIILLDPLQVAAGYPDTVIRKHKYTVMKAFCGLPDKSLAFLLAIAGFVPNFIMGVIFRQKIVTRTFAIVSTIGIIYLWGKVRMDMGMTLVFTVLLPLLYVALAKTGSAIGGLFARPPKEKING